MSERNLRDIMGSITNARYNYNHSYNPTYGSECDYDDYDNIEHDFMTDEM